MKKILGLLGATLITTVGSTSVVACGESKEQPNQKTDVEVTNDIKVALENDVDGSALDDTNKQSDAQELIKAAAKAVTDQDKVTEASFSFVNPDTPLAVGDNTVNIKISFKTATNITVAVKLTGVRHAKTDVEVTNDIKVALEKGVDGSSLNDTNKQSDAQTLIKVAAKAVTDQDKVTEASFSFVNPDTPLAVGDNTVNIKISFKTATNITVAVKLTGVKFNLSSITKLTGLVLTMHGYLEYKDLNSQIANANEFKSHPLADNYEIQYYWQTYSTTNMANDPQGGGAQYIVIKASSLDPYWAGETIRIKGASFGLH